MCQGTISPTWRFITNHERGFVGSQSGLEPPQQNYKALCFLNRTPPSQVLLLHLPWVEGSQFPFKILMGIGALAARWDRKISFSLNVKLSTLCRVATAYIFCFKFPRPNQKGSIFPTFTEYIYMKERWVLQFLFCKPPQSARTPSL